MAPVKVRNVRKHTIFSTVLTALFALKILALIFRIYRLPNTLF